MNGSITFTMIKPSAVESNFTGPILKMINESGFRIKAIKLTKLSKERAVPRSQVDLRRQKYLDIVTSILNEFPEVNVLDTLPAFCDNEYCWAIKNNKLLYRDHDHLNETGGAYLGDFLKNEKN